MKSITKELTSKWSKPVLALVVLVVLTTAMAKPARDPVSGSGSTTFNPKTGSFEGTARLVIRGQEKSAKLKVTVLGPPKISDEGVQHVVATHTFTFADGSITTSDKEIAEPTDTPGLYTLNANMEVVSGTGVYKEVSGHLTAHGTIDFRGPSQDPPLPATAEFELTGSISHTEQGE